MTSPKVGFQCIRDRAPASLFCSCIDALLHVLSPYPYRSVRVCVILQAIGQRNRKDTESETRKRRQQELQFLIAQKQSELQRLHDQHDSLLKVEQEQKVLMEKLNKH